MISDLERQLRDLAGKYRFHLPKNEIAEAATLCTDALAAGREGLELCWQFAAYLPPEALAEAIAATWPELDETLRREVIARHQRLPEGAAARLRLRSAVALRDVDPAAARRLLATACYALTSTPKQRPSKEQAKLLRSILLNGDQPALAGFRFENATQAEIGPLLTCVAVAFPLSPDEGRTFTLGERRIIEWLLENDLFTRLTESQRAGVVALVNSWPRTTKAAFAESHERLPAPLEDAMKTDASAALAETSLAPSAPVSTTAAEPARKANARELLDQLGAALRELESEKKAAREELREREAATQTLRSKLSQAESELQRAAQERTERRATSDAQETARQNAEREAAEWRSKVDELARELAIEREKHAADSQALLKRIEVEKTRAADAFSNRLGQKLRLEWRDFQSVSNRPMDVEVGESLRHLLRGIFEMLEREGLKIRD